MMTEQQGVRSLSEDIRQIVVEEVEGAKSRGWSQADIKRWFAARKVEVSDYKAVASGLPVADDVASVFAQISVTGLPRWPLAANKEDIRKHIEWLIDPVRDDYADALFEIAYDEAGGQCNAARLFDFDQVDEAVDFAVKRNEGGSNVYIAAALRLPDADRKKRGKADDFYVATAVPIDIDDNYDATRARMAEICDDGLVVGTGVFPERRSHHWTRLAEPCDDEATFGTAFRVLVSQTGADFKVKDSARLMCLGGTVKFPSQRKRDKGYLIELASVTIRPEARVTGIDYLLSLAGDDQSVVYSGASSPEVHREAGAANEISRDWTTKVVDGREAYFRNLLLAHLSDYQKETGADPSAQELFDSAFEIFADPQRVDHSDNRWVSEHGRAELMKRAVNTIRRLRGGYLAKLGLYSVETEAGIDIATQVAANRAETEKKSEEKSTEAFSEIAPRDDGPFRASDFVGEPAERRWVVKDWIVDGAVNSLYGDGGLGKTLLAQQLACCVSMGVPWLGIETIKGSVMAVLCEDDVDELHRRHNEIKAAMGYAVGNPFSDVWLWPRVGHDNVLVRWDRDAKATLGDFAQRLMDEIEDKQPSVLILDTLSDFYGGNEIDRVQVNYFVKSVLGGLIAARKAQGSPLTVLLLGHPSVSGKSSGSGFSGSTAWNNAVRSRIYLTRPEEGASDERILTRGKANYAKSGDETAIRLFYADGVLHASDDAEDGDSVLWGAMRDACTMVGNRWESGSPYNDRKDHDRFIHKALVDDLTKQGYKLSVARQAVRECIEEARIASGASNGKRGYRCV